MNSLMSYNDVAIPGFMYGTAWKKEQTAQLVELAVDSGFTAIDTANQLIHYQEALVGEALLTLGKKRHKAGIFISSDEIYFGFRTRPSHSLRAICRSSHTSSAIV